MRLGIAYNVFEGEELLEFVLRPIRHLIDHITAVYQTTSYFGNPASDTLLPTLQKLQIDGLIDELIHETPDLNVIPKFNEVRYRNVGLDRSIAASCTHHITADADEFYDPAQLAFAKTQMDGYDASLVGMEMYYKHPTWRITPNQKQVVPFIQSVKSRFDLDSPFPHQVDLTKRCTPCDNIRVFSLEEFTMHHMSHVRRDIRKKLSNNNNSKYFDVKKFLKVFDNYLLGERLAVAPDFRNRRTVLVDNVFNIEV